MKRTWLGLLCLVALLWTPTVGEAGDVQRTKDGCKNAHAILGWSTFTEKEQHEKPWAKVGWILGRRKAYLKQVEAYEPGVAQQASFNQYKVKGHKNASAYVAHCGYGGTCNMIAAVLYNIYKGIGTPRVYCGKLPKILIEPSNPVIPIPTDEEIRDADEEALEDDDDDMSFDDDDDDDDDDGGKKKKDDDLEAEFDEDD